MTQHPGWFGDGFCDPIFNNEECGYDGGDCCLKKRENWDDYCGEQWGGECICLTDCVPCADDEIKCQEPGGVSSCFPAVSPSFTYAF